MSREELAPMGRSYNGKDQPRICRAAPTVPRANPRTA